MFCPGPPLVVIALYGPSVDSQTTRLLEHLTHERNTAQMITAAGIPRAFKHRTHFHISFYMSYVPQVLTTSSSINPQPHFNSLLYDGAGSSCYANYRNVISCERTVARSSCF